MQTTYLLKDGESVLMETECKHVEAAVEEFYETYPNLHELGYSIGIKVI